MDPPSLDPPPDADYPAFVDENKDRRSMIWVGANDGMLHGIDTRLGKEVWAFIPFNLLPKLRALRSGQPLGDFRFYVDGSPKVADVKVGGEWRTYLVMGEGPGGTFYQTFDVTLPDMAQTVSPTSDNLASVLSYFSSLSSVPLKWAFPRYQHFDYTCSFSGGNCPATSPWGDIASGAPAIAKTVGETWSDPAVGQIELAIVPVCGADRVRLPQAQHPEAGQSQPRCRREHVLRARYRDRKCSRQPRRWQRRQR